VITLEHRTVSLRVDTRAFVVTAVLAALVVALALVALTTGDSSVPLGKVIATLFGFGDRRSDFVIFTLRLPRLLTGILVGAALGVSGAIVQTLTRNPLGSPDFVGLTIGASSGALIVLLVAGTDAVPVGVGAVLGCVATGLAVYALAFRRTGVQVFRLVLMGIGVSAMLEALNSFLVVRARLDEAVSAQVWLVGSLNGRGWQHVWPVALTLAVLLPVAAAQGRAMSLLGLGEEMATLQGVRVAHSRGVLLGIAVVLAAVATAAAGPIAFVALAAPQLAVRLTRSSGPGLLPAAAMGALLLSLSDRVAQELPGTLPVGVVTGAVGGAYLVWLLATEWRRVRL
jgi:iron complex transport system permease protein